MEVRRNGRGPRFRMEQGWWKLGQELPNALRHAQSGQRQPIKDQKVYRESFSRSEYVDVGAERHCEGVTLLWRGPVALPHATGDGKRTRPDRSGHIPVSDGTDAWRGEGNTSPSLAAGPSPPFVSRDHPFLRQLDEPAPEWNARPWQGASKKKTPVDRETNGRFKIPRQRSTFPLPDSSSIIGLRLRRLITDHPTPPIAPRDLSVLLA